LLWIEIDCILSSFYLSKNYYSHISDRPTVLLFPP